MNRLRWLALGIVLLGCGAYLISCVTAAPPPKDAPAPVKGVGGSDGVSLTVKITDLKSKDGELVISLFTKSDGFPMDTAKAFKSVKVSPEKPTHTFEGLPEGNYVVVVFHDVNKNGKMDTSTFGAPKEPIGMSNHPKISPPANMPNFDKGKVAVPKTKSIEINLIELGK